MSKYITNTKFFSNISILMSQKEYPSWEIIEETFFFSNYGNLPIFIFIVIE